MYAVYNHTGILPKDMTTDGVHLTKEGYKKWYKLLKLKFFI